MAQSPKLPELREQQSTAGAEALGASTSKEAILAQQAGTYKQRERTDAHRSCILRSTHPARRMLQAILAQYRTLHTPVIWTCAQVFQRLHIMHRQHRYMHSHRKVDQSSSLGRTDIQLRQCIEYIV